MKQKGRRENPPIGVKHRETTRDERMRIITLYDDAKWNWSQIARTLNIDRRTCAKIYKRWRHNNTPSNRSRTGRPPILDAEERARLEAFVTRDAHTRRLSWEAICLELGYACDPRTVRKAMHDMGYHKRLPRKKFNVSHENKTKRVAWCQARLHWTKEEWKRVIWTDESSFSTAGFGHRPWVIRKVDEEYHPDCIDGNFHSGRKSKMIWGAFCGTTKSQIVYVPGRAKIDAVTYIRTVLEPALVPFWHQCCEEYGWAIVQEDNAPGHKGYSNRYRALNGMETLEWPAQSPGLNPIESVWREIETELGEIWGRAEDIEALKTMIENIWRDHITEEILGGLIDSMLARLQAVIDAGGNPTRY